MNGNCVHEKFKSPLTSENACYHSEQNACYHSVKNACYHSVQNLLSSSLLSKNTKIKIYRSTILLVVLCGC
jgi:hypothetical protein